MADSRATELFRIAGFRRCRGRRRPGDYPRRTETPLDGRPARHGAAPALPSDGLEGARRDGPPAAR